MKQFRRAIGFYMHTVSNNNNNDICYNSHTINETAHLNQQQIALHALHLFFFFFAFCFQRIDNRSAHFAERIHEKKKRGLPKSCTSAMTIEYIKSPVKYVQQTTGNKTISSK